jgi:hypothetical protein
MKKLRTIKTTLVLAGALTMQACGQLPTQQATLKVVDQDGRPVEGADVAMGFDVGPDGNGIGVKTSTQRAKSPASGVVVLSGGNTSGYSGISARKEGYYEARHVFQAKARVSGRWEPWNPEIKLVLKEKRNPVAMYGFSIREGVPGIKDLVFPSRVPRGPAGFDLLKHDWVAPHGKGEQEDIRVSVRMEEEPRPMKWPKGWMVFEFPGPGNGIRSTLETSLWGAGLLSAHEAPEGGYASKREFGNFVGSMPVPAGAEANWTPVHVFRVRTVLDEQGKVVSALHGKLYGHPRLGLFNKDGSAKWRMTYYLNPDPHSRNLECDPSKNLFTDLAEGNWPREP